MPDKEPIVTIDGPSGVGKSTISRRLASQLGFTYLDTGAMYRAVALACRDRGVIMSDEWAISRLLAGLRMELLPAQGKNGDVRVILDGGEVSDQLRSPEISMLASTVSALQAVRRHLTRMQQEIGRRGHIVAEGRDTGTVVFPGAAWKFFLDAAPEERCRRRMNQLRERGQHIDPEVILAQILERDRNDRERSIAPLRAASDAVLLDTTSMSVDQVVARMLEQVKRQPVSVTIE